MRAIIVILALLAAGKIGAQAHLYQSATTDVIIAAYRERAIEACQADPKSQTLLATPALWTRPSAIRLVIGKGEVDVYPWQIDHHLWNARFKNPYLFLTTHDAARSVVCEYDVVNNQTAVHRM